MYNYEYFEEFVYRIFVSFEIFLNNRFLLYYNGFLEGFKNVVVFM